MSRLQRDFDLDSCFLPCARFDGEESEGEDLMDADIMRRDYAPGV
jgi:hypothetical protein